MSDTLLVYGRPGDSADLWHAIPLELHDRFLYVEAPGRRVAVVDVLDAGRLEGRDVKVLDPDGLGRAELALEGMSGPARDTEVALRACLELGVTRARIGRDFPALVADRLRAGGVNLVVDIERFSQRRRSKSPAQLEGIRRAQAAADAAMGVAAELVRALPAGLTSEDVRSQMQAICAERGCELRDDSIVQHGSQSAMHHEPGSGAIAAGDGVLVDIGPRDKASGCYTDMSRTFVAGAEEPDGELAMYWRLCVESMNAVRETIGAGVSGRDVYVASARPFELAGQPTKRTHPPSAGRLEHGYHHNLGHGVGIEVHERPEIGFGGTDVLAAGDVVAIEPGCYRPGFGGCRLEDVVIVTDDGCEPLTSFPFDL